MTRIVICRHGNTFDKGDVITRVGARTDLPLSTSGIAQSKALAAHFSPSISGFTFIKAYCSILQRTHHTGDMILSSGHPLRDLKILSFLTEIDYGVDENKAEEDVLTRLGRDAITLWDEKAIPPQGWKVNPAALIQSWIKFFESCQKQKGDILVVTSNGIARFALDAVDQIVVDAPRKLRTAAYGIIEIKNGKSRVASWDVRPN
jgi:probable phosphoglycerate mutase